MAAIFLLGYASVAAAFYVVLRARAPIMDGMDEGHLPRTAEIVELFPTEVRKAA